MDILKCSRQTKTVTLSDNNSGSLTNWTRY